MFPYSRSGNSGTLATVPGGRDAWDNLIQASPGLQKIAIALGWNVPSQYEMDVSAFMLGKMANSPMSSILCSTIMCDRPG
ncbi:MAG: TerD family protein [Desertifilum sp. SIO1I2]|nr:TerD family protein [Desertifilum sp. SIO1I2]